ncbi:DNA polymerase III subunit gamma and tau [Actinomyces provencensis]|uniref:DNA polymerase III subunit gamma and tau n=1 Tax=Actinomyces provencensis TaxID=1720198 RepID=UPI00096AB3C7|nr:DNA polymerase III subunit gamma and tau [Actinomyces provencensis]
MTTALYRRYRPDTFDEVIGQDHVTEPLRAALRANRVTHAYLFSGPRGCGKTTSARILARCLNCAEGPTDTPCGHCDSCRELATGGSGSLDVVEIDAASHGGVDDARDLRERATFAPVRDRYKVFIIDEAHMVTTQGFNALLKLVEEPPEHVKFIFATTEPERVIGTIRSRTHHYPFRLVPPDVLEPYLQKLCDEESITVGDGVLGLVVRAGGGSVRDTLSVLDQLMAGSPDGNLDYHRAVALLGYTDSALLDQTVDALAGGDGAAVYRVVERMVESGHDPRRFVEDLLQRLRDLLIIAVAGDGAVDVLSGTPTDQLERMQVQARNWGPRQLSRAADLTDRALRAMTGATSPRLQLELLLGRILVPPATVAAPADGPVPGTVGMVGGGAPRDQGQRTAVQGGGSGGGAGYGAAQAKAEFRRRKSSNADQHEGAASPGGVGSQEDDPRRSDHRQDSAASRQGSGQQTSPRQQPQAQRPGQQRPDQQGPGRAEAQQRADRRTPVGPSAQEHGWAEEVAPIGGAAGQQTPRTTEQDAPTEVVHDQSPAGVGAPGQRADVRGDRGQSVTGQSAATPPTGPTGAQVSVSPGDDAAARPTGAGGPGDAARDADMLRQRWSEVVERLSSISRATWSLVQNNGQLGGVDGSVAVILFPTDGLLGAFTHGNRSADVEKAIHEATGLDLSVRAEVGQAGGGPSVTTPGAVAAAPPAGPAAPARERTGDDGRDGRGRDAGGSTDTSGTSEGSRSHGRDAGPGPDSALVQDSAPVPSAQAPSAQAPSTSSSEPVPSVPPSDSLPAADVPPASDGWGPVATPGAPGTAPGDRRALEHDAGPRSTPTGAGSTDTPPTDAAGSSSVSGSPSAPGPGSPAGSVPASSPAPGAVDAALRAPTSASGATPPVAASSASTPSGAASSPSRPAPTRQTDVEAVTPVPGTSPQVPAFEDDLEGPVVEPDPIEDRDDTGWSEAVAAIPGGITEPAFEDDSPGPTPPTHGGRDRGGPPSSGRWQERTDRGNTPTPPEREAGADDNDDGAPEESLEPVAGAHPAVAASLDDTASVDDADMETTTSAGLPAVLEILGGTVIEEIADDGKDW